MSHGWSHRLRAGSIGLAFAAGLSVAGILHLPAFSAAQQPAASAVAKPTPIPDASNAPEDSARFILGARSTAPNVS